MCLMHVKPIVEIKVKVKVVHLYSAARKTDTYPQNALQLPPSRATPPNLGLKIPGRKQPLTLAGWGLTLSVP